MMTTMECRRTGERKTYNKQTFCDYLNKGPYNTIVLQPRPEQALSGGKGCWRHSRQDEPNSRPLARLAIEREPAAQTVRNDAVDDMQTQTSVALIAPCREERIERFTPDVETHAATIVGKKNFDIVISGRSNLDVDGTSFAVRKPMRDRVEEEVGQHLSIGPWIAVHRQAGLAFDVEGEVLLPQARPQAHGDLFSQIAEVEDALTRVTAVGRYLFERLDQFGCVIEVGDQLRRRLAADLEKLIQT